MGLSNYAENEILDHSLSTGAWTMPTVAYVSLHTGAPGDTGASENTSAGRQGDAAFNAAASGATANTSALTWTSMPAITVVGVGIWDNATPGSGNLLWSGSLSSSVVCGSGDTFEIAAGDLDITLD